VNRKVGYDRAFMTGLIKEGNLQRKPHCDLEKSEELRREIEKTHRATRYPRSFQQRFRAVGSRFAVWHHLRLEHLVKCQGEPTATQDHHRRKYQKWKTLVNKQES
jgi:NAD-dependent oxidoreductase involved in siderophore biosynthesis